MNGPQKALMGLFLFAGILATKTGMAQSETNDVQATKTAKMVTTANKVLDKAKDSATAAFLESRLAKVNDSDFVQSQKDIGMKLTSRALGFIDVTDEQGNPQQDSCVFYRFVKEVDGYKVEKNIVLAHPYQIHTDEFPDFNSSQVLYAEINAEALKDDKIGKTHIHKGDKMSLVFNREDGDRMLTNVIDPDGKQVTLNLTTEDLDKMDQGIQTNPGGAFDFAHQASGNNKPTVMPVARPSSEQNNPDGSFKILHIRDRGFGHNVTFSRPQMSQ